MNRLKELRKSKGLLQREVALNIGVSTQSYGYYENGINKPDPDMLIRLADFFNCSIDYLVGREDDFGNIISGDIKKDLSKDEQTLLDCFNKMTPFERESILIQMKALSNK